MPSPARPAWLPHLTRFDGVVLAVLVASRLALFAVDAPNRALIGAGELPYYEDTYPGLARGLADDGRYLDPARGAGSDLVRPPGYPAVLAATYLATGDDGTRGPSLWVLLWNVAGVVALYLGLLRLLADFGLGRRVAAVLFTADLGWLLYSKEVVTEPIYTPLVVWAVVGLLAAARARPSAPAARWAGGAGLMLGLSALLKPISLYLPIVVLPFLVVARRDLGPALVFAAAFAVCVGPWLARNRVVHGVATFTATQNDNLLFAHGALVWADVQGVTHLQAQDQLDARLQRRLAGAGMGEGRPATFAIQNRVKAALAREVLGEHPVAYARAIVRGMAVTLLDPGRLVFNRTFPTEDPRAIGLLNIVGRDGVWGAFRALVAKDPGLAIPMVLYLGFLAAVAAAAVAGVVPMWRADAVACVLLMAVAGYLLVLGGPNGYARFRLYVFPFELAFAQAAADALSRWRAARRSAPPAVVSAPPAAASS